MPELPEVETVARDLRGLVVGARITGVRVSWLKTLRSQDPEAFARAVVGRTIVGTSRRAKLVVLDLDDGGAITIHLKMTGQLFVVNAGVMEDPYIRLILTFADGRELWFRDIRKFGRVGVARRDGPDGDLRGELGGDKGFKGFGPEPLDATFTARVFRKGIRGRQGRLKPLLLDQALRRRHRQHLCRRGALGGPPPSAPLRIVAPTRRRGPPVPGDSPHPRGGGRAARLVDRRLHGARRRRRDAGAS